MVERVKSTRRTRGGRRPGAGRKKGSRPEYKRVLAARAARDGPLAHELMLEWARTGMMTYPNGKRVELDVADRINCAKGCAAHYHAPMQAVRHAGDAEQPVVLTLDEKVVAALARRNPAGLEVLRDVLTAIQTGTADEIVAAVGPTKVGDAAAYAATFGPDSRTAGPA